ncbi:MAG: zf-HC2 domain-containing protein [Phycisphaerae bacterium]|nr:zf-HC2 domain-containing protein [Phycisphaerae bacterium]
MTCRDNKDLMMAYLDGELDDKQTKMLQEHLAQCTQCSKELEEFKSLKSMTDNIVLSEPEDQVWQRYWDNVYNRVERGIGWMLMSMAGVCLAVFGGFKMVECIVTDPSVSLFLKVALLVMILGLSILLISIMRERLYFWKHDRYRHVRR